MKIPENKTFEFIAHGSQSVSANTWHGIMQGCAALMDTYSDDDITIYEWSPDSEEKYVPIYRLRLEEL